MALVTPLMFLGGCKAIQDAGNGIRDGIRGMTGESSDEATAIDATAPSEEETAAVAADAARKPAEPAEPHPERVTTQSSDNERTHVELKGFEAYKVQQEDPVWCWAACAQMVSKYLGKERSQSEIVERIKGAGEDGSPKREAASRYETLCSLVPERSFQPFGEVFDGAAERIGEDPESLLSGDRRLHWDSELFRNLKNKKARELLPKYVSRLVANLPQGYPYVVGLHDEGSTLGHVMVLYGITYQESAIATLPALIDDIKSIGQDEEETRSSRTKKKKKKKKKTDLERLTDALDMRYDLLEVNLIDPWDGEAKTMKGKAFLRKLDFAYSTFEALEELDQWHNLVKTEDKK